MHRRHGFWASGIPFIWLSAACLSLILILLAGLFCVIFYNGGGAFWPARVAELRLANGDSVVGEITAREEVPGGGGALRMQVKRGNRDIFGSDFIWLDEKQISRITYPERALVLERMQWGSFYGYPTGFEEDGQSPVSGYQESLHLLAARLPEAQEIRRQLQLIEQTEAAHLAHKQERLRAEVRRLQGSRSHRITKAEASLKQLEGEFSELEERLSERRRQLKWRVVLEVPGSAPQKIALADIVRSYQPNRLSRLGRAGVYFGRLQEFLFGSPREANTEGGVFPAIFGTVLMVLIMSIVVAPVGVLSAVYLREYAKQGRIVSFVRIAVNNLAGVPSIVFGVFGLGFFVYGVGGKIDRLLFSEYLPAPTFGTGGILWASLTLALLTLPTVIVATEEGLAAVPRSLREASYALGATKFETTWNVVLPSLMPAILTGLILAVSRAAGEVAPLMITGVVKLAPTLPVDLSWPFLHLDRKFMHLGFQIYDVGFQSPNVDAARPMVFMTTILLLLLVLLLNLAAIILRNKLRKRYSTSAI